MKRFLFSVFLCLFSSDAYADIATGLVGWWKLVDGAGTTCLDASGNANTGTTHNAPTWVAGHIGNSTNSNNALDFVAATSQYVVTAAATNIPKINASQTLSVWVNIPSTAAVYDTVVPELNGSGANQLRISGGDIQVSQWGGTTTITGGAVSINTWHMLTWTYNSVGPLNTVYIDGVQSGATTATATQNFTPTAVYLGSYGAGAGNENYGGIMDDARIYSRALSAADVAQLYTYTGRNGLFSLIAR
jgi:hypothetical protein